MISRAELNRQRLRSHQQKISGSPQDCPYVNCNYEVKSKNRSFGELLSLTNNGSGSCDPIESAPELAIVEIYIDDLPASGPEHIQILLELISVRLFE